MLQCEKDQRIVVGVDGDKITSVVPAVAIVDLGTGVTWDVGKLPPGYTVEIDFRVQGTVRGPKKGPFGEGGFARQRGRYVTGGAQALPSNPSDQQERGVWKYDVILRKGDADVDAIDPSIIIRE